jgi:hypothetical protein
MRLFVSFPIAFAVKTSLAVGAYEFGFFLPLLRRGRLWLGGKLEV